MSNIFSDIMGRQETLPDALGVVMTILTRQIIFMFRLSVRLGADWTFVTFLDKLCIGARMEHCDQLSKTRAGERKERGG